MVIRKIKSILAVLLVATIAPSSQPCYAQQKTGVNMTLYYPPGQTIVNPPYMNNLANLTKLSAVFMPENIPYIDSLYIQSYASPEGSTEKNNILADSRAYNFKEYILNHYPGISSSRITAKGMGENWNGLKQLVEQDMNTPNRIQILEILDDTNPKKQLLITEERDSWNYMLKNHFPLLRIGSSMAITINPNAPSKIRHSINNTLNITEAILPEEESKAKDALSTPPPPLIETTSTYAFIVPQETSITKKPLLALKTNLLFDAVTALNLEIEVPIGNRWSVAGEYIFPWWLWSNKQNCLEIISGNLEGRYWLGDRSKKEVMTGWFAGAYSGGGYYDLEKNKKGQQGEFFVIAASGGFVHKIARNLRMEYSLGLGYIFTHYRKYEAQLCMKEHWHLVRKGSDHYNWFGPTKIKISLVWMINRNVKGGIK